MLKMQTEFTSVNALLQQLLGEKRQTMKCRCSHRIRDLERQVLELHKDLYQVRRANAENENAQPRAPTISLNALREVITPKQASSGDMKQRRIIIPLSTKNVDITDTEILASLYDPDSSSNNNKRPHSKRRSVSGGRPTSSKASSQKPSIERVKPRAKAAAPALNTRLLSVTEKNGRKPQPKKR